MLISLLSRVLQSQRGRGSGILSRRGVQSAGQELADRAAGAGTDLPNRGDLPGGVVPSGAQSLPSQQPAQSQAGPQVQGRVQGPQLPSPQLAQEPSGPSEGERQFRGHIANMVRRAAGGEIPNGAAGWIREVTKDAGSRTAGERGKTGFVGKLFGLDQVPGLTKTQSHRLKQQGLITAGLAMMGSPQQASFAQTLAAGVFAARADTAETAGQLMDVRRAQQQVQERARIFQNPDLSPVEQWEAFRETALASGDTEGAELATDVIGQLNEASASELNAELVDVNGDGVKEEVIRAEDGSLTVRDPYTKDVIEQRPAQPVSQKEVQDRVNQLSDDYMKASGDLWETVRQAQSVMGAGTSAAADQSRIIALTKLRDPGSVVRPSEARATRAIGGASERLQTMWNKLASGGELSAGQRRMLDEEIQRLGQERVQQLQGINQFWTKRARSAGVDPGLVVRPATELGVEDPFAGPPPSVDDDDEEEGS